jgi:hypothetical protein
MDRKRADTVTGIVERTLLLQGAFAFHRDATRIAAQIERSPEADRGKPGAAGEAQSTCAVRSFGRREYMNSESWRARLIRDRPGRAAVLVATHGRAWEARHAGRAWTPPGCRAPDAPTAALVRDEKSEVDWPDLRNKVTRFAFGPTSWCSAREGGLDGCLPATSIVSRL